MSLGQIISAGRLLLAEFPLISGLADDVAAARAILDREDPALIPRIEARAAQLARDLMGRLDPVGIAVVAKAVANKPLTEDEQRWMDRASGQGG